MSHQPKVIAIDGFSSTGKSSLSKKVAEELGFIHIDTGAMYRAISLYALQHNMVLDNGEVKEQQLIEALDRIHLTFELNPSTQKNEIVLNGENVETHIRSMEVSNVVSQVAKIAEVREFLVIQQRNMAEEKGIVMDGRDIGTVVFPDAPVKIFLSASPSVRAQRRYDELVANGKDIAYAEVEANLRHRDKIDSEREASPLMKAEDAIEINNDALNQEETLAAVLQVVANKGLVKS